MTRHRECVHFGKKRGSHLPPDLPSSIEVAPKASTPLIDVFYLALQLVTLDPINQRSGSLWSNFNGLATAAHNDKLNPFSFRNEHIPCALSCAPSHQIFVHRCHKRGFSPSYAPIKVEVVGKDNNDNGNGTPIGNGTVSISTSEEQQRRGGLQATDMELQNPFRNKCQQCGKSFKRSDFLKRHQRLVHMKVRNHACDMCEKDLVTRGT